MKIKLNKLVIRNFKGFKDYTFEPAGQSVNVQGDNGTGKTSLYDAFLWALFGKNSADQSDTKFDWKPLDENNQPIHHLETSVEVFLDIDGSEKVLKRTISEDWQRVRNAIEETFKGHTTVYQLDGINVKQKDYKAYLDELIGEEQFKILTNISYFPEKLKMEDRRQTLINMVGDVSDADVIKSNPELKPLTSLIADKSIEDIETLTTQKMSEIKKQIKTLPGRIDEVDRSLPVLTGLNYEALNQQKTSILAEVEAKRASISDIKNGLAIGELKQEIKQLELHYKEKEQEFNEETYTEISHWQAEIEDVRNQMLELKQQANDIDKKRHSNDWEISRKKDEITKIESTNDYNRDQYRTIQTDIMEPFDEHRSTCQTCGQDFPQEKMLEIQSNYQKEVEEFNSNKAKKLEQIQTLGKANNLKIDQLNEEISSMRDENKSLNSDSLHDQVGAKNGQVIELLRKIDALRDSTTKFGDTEVSQEINKEIIELGLKVKKSELSTEIDINKLNQQITELNNTIHNDIDNKLYQFDLHEKQSVRRQELINEDQLLSQEYGVLEQRKFLLEEFVRTKVSLLTDTINSKFKYVKFKLFETAINGGLKEVCEPTVNGVPYSTGLNNAGVINAGLDIINTLMTHSGISAPVFIDNSEGVNEISEIDAQLITLSVTKHKALRVEVL